MTRALSAVAMILVLGVVPAGARGPGGHGGHGGFGGHGGGPHGHFGPHGHSRIFIDGGFFFDPFFPYYYPYYEPYPVYAYPPPPYEAPPEESPEATAEGEESAPPESAPPTREEALRASYGLVQVRGVPDGAAVDLDGRFWVTAKALGERWLAIPQGEHVVTVRVPGFDPEERRVDVKPGKAETLRFGPFRTSTG
jgi:hypothetical protein